MIFPFDGRAPAAADDRRTLRARRTMIAPPLNERRCDDPEIGEMGGEAGAC
jgi:hypothetical protein